MRLVKKTLKVGTSVGVLMGCLALTPMTIGALSTAAVAQGMQNDCEMPKPKNGSLVEVIGTESGAYISSVYFDDSKITTAASVQIKDGKEPIYLVLANNVPTIWNLEGDVKRIERVVVRDRNSGVAGVAKDVVAFPDQACMRLTTKKGSFEYVLAKTSLEKSMGAAISEYDTNQTVSTAALPSLQFEDLRKVREEAMRTLRSRYNPGGGMAIFRAQAMMNRYPGGVLKFDPAKVVGMLPAKAYAVLPAEFGLEQLVTSGHLEVIESNQFRIVKPIEQFPSALANYKFVLAKGVPAPAGDIGNNCMISEETGKISGARCEISQQRRSSPF